MLRLGFLGNNAAGAARDGTTFANPLLGVTYARSLGDGRLALFAATTLPLGTGGGNDRQLPDRDRRRRCCLREARLHRARRSNAAAERPRRGEESAAASDVARTRAAVGAHIGVYIGSHVSLGADLLYQRWLSHPTKLDFMTGARAPISDADMAALTASVGVRAHFNVGQVSVHPGCRSREGSTRPARRLVR